MFHCFVSLNITTNLSNRGFFFSKCLTDLVSTKVFNVVDCFIVFDHT